MSQSLSRACLAQLVERQTSDLKAVLLVVGSNPGQAKQNLSDLMEKKRHSNDVFQLAIRWNLDNKIYKLQFTSARCNRTNNWSGEEKHCHSGSTCMCEDNIHGAQWTSALMRPGRAGLRLQIQTHWRPVATACSSGRPEEAKYSSGAKKLKKKKPGNSYKHYQC